MGDTISNNKAVKSCKSSGGLGKINFFKDSICEDLFAVLQDLCVRIQNHDTNVVTMRGSKF